MDVRPVGAAGGGAGLTAAPGSARAFLLAIALIATLSAPARAQGDREWWDREFGIGVVKYAAMETYTAADVIRTAPSRTADTVAVLRADSLCFHGARPCARSYDRMIEFEYEIAGWAVLGFSSDSGWAFVTLAPGDSAGPTGWVELRGEEVRVQLWSEILTTVPLFFLRPAHIGFFGGPDSAASLSRTLARHPEYERVDYIMNPLERRGRWLRVELLSPSPMCVFPEPNVVPDTVWIEYLRPDGRPRVFYYTRGC